MARTERRIPGYINGRQYDPTFLRKLVKGHVCHSAYDDYGWEYWTPEGKRFVKRLRARKGRREGLDIVRGVENEDRFRGY